MQSFTLSLFTASLLALSACGTPGESTSLSTGMTDGSTDGAGTMTSTSSVPVTGPDDTTAAGTTTGSSGENTSGTTTGPTTGETDTTTETTVESDTMVDPGTGSSSTTTNTSVDTTNTSVDTTASTTTGETTTGDPTSGVACAALGPMQCMEQDACQEITGSKLHPKKLCLGKLTFFECSPVVVCDEVPTYGCEVMVTPPEPFLFQSSCLPMGWKPCEAPAVSEPCK